MFEIHVTVESNFIANCKEFGCKPILIELEFGKLCIENNFHKSKNVFKKIDNDTFYLMATYRTNVIDLIRFDKIISNFKNVLNNNSFEFDKVEVEACIIDTNESLDYKWLL